MKSDEFFISVIIPVYNGEGLLAEAVESIQRQNYYPLEIIVVDDGSTDGTARVAAGFKDYVFYVYQANSGAPAARNRGLKMARGNVIGFLDADDLWSENKLELQLTYLATDPSVEIVLGHTQHIRLSGAGESDLKFEKSPISILAPSFGGAIFRKSAFDKVGFLDERLLYNDDVDWFLRAKELGIRMVIHQEVTQFYRRHEHNITNQISLNQSYYVAAIKKSLDRRRKSTNATVKPISKWRKPDE